MKKFSGIYRGHKRRSLCNIIAEAYEQDLRNIKLKEIVECNTSTTGRKV